jgi:serine/threonine kinase 16
MDFGSVGPLTQSLALRRDAIQVAETASQHTTLPYRPPELLEGGIRTGDDDLDYRKVDVWSLGCTLFAMCYGASPFESEFRSHSGELRIVDCTQLKILGDIPMPPEGSDVKLWFSSDITSLIESMLEQDRFKRPDLDSVIVEVERLIHKLGGQLPVVSKQPLPEDDSDLNALLSNNRYV